MGPSATLVGAQGIYLKYKGKIMGTVNIIKAIKYVHPSCMVIVKVGTFYDVYSQDAYILSYLMKYKIREKENIPFCTFPVNSISKVANILEKNKINYIVVDKRSNYEEEYKEINKQENNYDKIYEKAQKTVEITLRIQRIYNSLIKQREEKNIEEKIKEIEKIIRKNDKRRKV